MVLEAEAVAPEDMELCEEEEDEQPEKVMRLYDSYRQRRPSGAKSAATQLRIRRYLELAEVSEDSALDFWSKNKVQFSMLVPLIQRTLSITASSAPVERVFSHGGIILRPHRARLLDPHQGVVPCPPAVGSESSVRYSHYTS